MRMEKRGENMNEYVTTKLPKQLMHDIDKVMTKANYTSRMEFIKDAVRRRLEEINNGEEIERNNQTSQ